MNEFNEGQIVVYVNGDSYELGRIKRLTPTGAFVYYSEGETAAMTPYDCIHPLRNSYVIKQQTLGGIGNGDC